jgi:hypothetical protein
MAKNDKVVDLVPQKEKIQNIDVYFKDSPIPLQIIDILGYQVGSHWVAVSLKDGTTLVYKYDDIHHLVHKNVDKE